MTPEAGQGAGAPAIEVAAGLIFRDGRLLLTRRRASDHLGGLWEFPGGKREAGESFQDCLRRELAEELGVEAEVGALLEAITHHYPEKTVHLRFFQCRLLWGEPQPLGCAAVVWVGVEQLDGYAFPAADGRLLNRLKSERGLWRS